MEDNLVERVMANPNYQKLVATRSSYGWTMTWLMLIVYYGFITLIAFDKELLGAKIGAGVMTWGMPIGLFVIVFTVIITGIYVRRANDEFDTLTAAIRKEVL
ncbi:DUF485 domain-containing protein [Actimicrobium sp. CCI2.3]|uniref:DUF485 domain-containing protein n=1 Tax=Actimicrobium sp. CCI2.3 TaxID=3048616 RepID=UPI002AB38279|nr:DUF485 domain-containing protein [Actimicrobium sp. CCI2.3]MDY7573628.1 DUF485 domain-containing protein [Actimicrobium sp. CCI2.3]MEB0021101.1 DUF485 domain-containing protein [Actimicrobium sp. CCI2.3]